MRLLVFLLLFATACGDESIDEKERARAALSNVAMVGASFTAGFASRASADQVLRTTLTFDPDVHGLGDILFSRGAEQAGAEQVGHLSTIQPSMVIGIDFLFWYGYGSNKTLEERQASVAVGLETIAEVGGPLYFGDLPDMTGADPTMISEDMIPPPADQAILNEQIRTFAAEEPHLHIFPLAKWLADLRAGAVTLDGERIEVAFDEVFAADGLHPNLHGHILLAQLYLEVMTEEYPGLDQGLVNSYETMLDRWSHALD